jgi:hypothetical protein
VRADPACLLPGVERIAVPDDRDDQIHDRCGSP